MCKKTSLFSRILFHFLVKYYIIINMNTQCTTEKGKGPDEAMICPYCSGYGFLDAGPIPSPCVTCGGSGWLTKSVLEEWEADNSTDEWMDGSF